MNPVYRRIVHLNEDDKGLHLTVVTAIFLSIATVMVPLRLLSRKLQRAALAANDYWIIAALILTWGVAAAVILDVVAGGVGQNAEQETMAETIFMIKTADAANVLWILATSAIKVSLILFYIHVFDSERTDRKFHLVAHVSMLIVTLYSVAAILLVVLQCVPLESSWELGTKGKCEDIRDAALATAIMNLIANLIVFGLPVPMVWSLCLPIRRRISLITVFGFGILVCLVSVIRLVWVIMTNYTLHVNDILFNLIRIDYTSILEPCLGITTACLPILCPVIEKVSPKSIASWFRSGTRDDTRSRPSWVISSPSGCTRISQWPMQQPNHIGKVPNWTKASQEKSPAENREDLARIQDDMRIKRPKLHAWDDMEFPVYSPSHGMPPAPIRPASVMAGIGPSIPSYRPFKDSYNSRMSAAWEAHAI